MKGVDDCPQCGGSGYWTAVDEEHGTTVEMLCIRPNADATSILEMFATPPQTEEDEDE